MVTVRPLLAGGARGVGTLCLAAALVLAACGGATSTLPLGTVADSGFRPPSNGLPFANYGAVLADGAAPTDLTPADVRAMFGDAVCADAKVGRCDLVPEAQGWMDSTNKGMAGGHCYGFSVLAELLWERKLNIATLGAAATPGLAISNNQALQRLIAYSWAFQLLGSVGSKGVTGAPNKVLGALRKALRPNPSETYTIVLFKPDFSAGHAVTPYRVVNKGDGRFDVFVYDNNWPGAARAISFDTKANTWTYMASTNPNEASAVYTGTAKTKTLSLLPTSPGLGTQPCPFCDKVPANPSLSGGLGVKGTEEVSLLGGTTRHANMVITDHGGHHLGYVDGKIVEQIGGGHVQWLISGGDWDNNVEPDFFVPARGTYTITIDGSGLTSPDTETLRVIGPSWDISVDDIPVRPGEKDTLTVTPGATEVSYTSSSVETPTLEVGVSDERADYAFVVSGVADRPGSTITLSLPAEGDTVTLRNAGTTATSSVDLKMTRETARGADVFVHHAVPLAGGDTAQLRFGEWSGAHQGIPLLTVHDGRRSNQSLSDEQAG